MKTLIIASSKPWHKAIFDQVNKKSNLKCSYISTPDELDSALKTNTNFHYIFFLHWNWKVSSEIFQKYECICFHMTDLPYGRGGSPLQNLILDGKTETMISAFKMTEEMDAGPIYAKKSMSLDGRAEDIFKRAGMLSLEIINWIIQNEPVPEPQKYKPKYFNRRKPEQSLMPTQGTLSQIYDLIRMLDAPTYPLTFIDYGDFRLEFSHSKLFDNFIEARVMIKKKV